MTIEPSLALQQAIRTRLVATPAVVELVPAAHIRDGSTRPEKFPTIIIGDGQTVLEGYYAGWRNVTIYLDVHVWAIEAGLATVKAIAHAVSNAIGRAIEVPDYQLTDGVHITQVRYMRDPSKEHGHAVLSIEAVIGGEFAE